MKITPRCKKLSKNGSLFNEIKRYSEYRTQANKGRHLYSKIIFGAYALCYVSRKFRVIILGNFKGAAKIQEGSLLAWV